MIIPSVPLPPYYQYIGSTEGTTNVSVRYFLKFKVKVKDLFTNFDIIAPIILGTEPKPDTNQQQVSDSSGYFISFDSGKDIFKDDSPLSYVSLFSPT